MSFFDDTGACLVFATKIIPLCSRARIHSPILEITKTVYERAGVDGGFHLHGWR